MIRITEKEIMEMIEESPCCPNLSTSDKDEIISHILNLNSIKKEEHMEVNSKSPIG